MWLLGLCGWYNHSIWGPYHAMRKPLDCHIWCLGIWTVYLSNSASQLFNGNGWHLSSAWKLRSEEWWLGHGPKTGWIDTFSDPSGPHTSSICTLISCKDTSISVDAQSWKVVLTSSPYLFKLASYSQEWHSTSKSSAASRGFLIQMFSEFVLTKATIIDLASGYAKHLFTINPKGEFE